MCSLAPQSDESAPPGFMQHFLRWMCCRTCVCGRERAGQVVVVSSHAWALCKSCPASHIVLFKVSHQAYRLLHFATYLPSQILFFYALQAVTCAFFQILYGAPAEPKFKKRKVNRNSSSSCSFVFWSVCPKYTTLPPEVWLFMHLNNLHFVPLMNYWYLCNIMVLEAQLYELNDVRSIKCFMLQQLV